MPGDQSFVKGNNNKPEDVEKISSLEPANFLPKYDQIIDEILKSNPEITKDWVLAYLPSLNDSIEKSSTFNINKVIENLSKGEKLVLSDEEKNNMEDLDGASDDDFMKAIDNLSEGKWKEAMENFAQFHKIGAFHEHDKSEEFHKKKQDFLILQERIKQLNILTEKTVEDIRKNLRKQGIERF